MGLRGGGVVFVLFCSMGGDTEVDYSNRRHIRIAQQPDLMTTKTAGNVYESSLDHLLLRGRAGHIILRLMWFRLFFSSRF